MAEGEGFNGSTDDAGGELDFVAKASELGWVPQEDWHGKPELWKPAQEYVEFAESYLPVLKQNNKALMQKIHERDVSVQSLQQKVDEQSRILKVLAEESADTKASQTEDQISTLRAQLVEANREGDHELIAGIQEKLMDLKLELKNKPVAPVIDPTKPDSKQPKMSAEDQAIWDGWVADNAWYKDPVYAAAATAIGSVVITEAIAQGDDAPKGRKLLDEITKRMDNKFNLSKRGRSDKVGGGEHTNSSGGSVSSDVGYAKLPADAKAMCEAQAKKFVGPGKRYEKLSDWQKRFAQQYFAD
jgi:hypothetical protein